MIRIVFIFFIAILCSSCSGIKYYKIHELIVDGDEAAAIAAIPDARIDVRDFSGFTSLHLAVAWKRHDVLEALIKNGADINARSMYGSPLITAAGTGDLIALEILLNAGARTEPFSKGPNPMSTAIANSQWDVIPILLAHGASTEVREIDGETALILGAEAGKFKIVKMLVNAGADIQATANDGRSALHTAAASNSQDILIFLESKGAVASIAGGSDIAIVSTAKLYEIKGKLASVAGDNQLATEFYKTSSNHYNRASNLFAVKAENLGKEVRNTLIRNALTIIMSGLMTTLKTRVNTVRLPDGRKFSIGTHFYTLEGVDFIWKLKNVYEKLSKKYAYKSGKIKEIITNIGK